MQPSTEEMVNHGVENELRSRIKAKGAITFAEFAQAALYWPTDGYYATQRPFGARGDFYTAPSAHPLFGVLLASQVQQMWRLAGAPSRYWVVELGAGEGRMAQDTLATAPTLDPGFAQAVEYVAVDLQRPAAAAQDGVHWLQSAAPPAKPFAGCVIANELLDAMPVHRVTMRDGSLAEVYVGLDEHGRFTEVVDEPSTPALVQRFETPGITLPEGYRTEVNLGLERWVEEVARSLNRGYLLVIDYGHEASALYDESRSRGTLRCYYQHTLNANPYQHVGRQDISVHVDFTSLMGLARAYGFDLAGYTTQAEFLSNLGLPHYRESIARRGDLASDVRRANLHAIDTLVGPDGLGAFKVLALTKGMPDTRLHGFTSGNPLLHSLERHAVDLQAPLLTADHLPGAGQHLESSAELPTWEELLR